MRERNSNPLSPVKGKMFAASLALTLLSASAADPISNPKAGPIFLAHAIGPRGEVAVTIQQKDKHVLGILDKGKFTPIPPLPDSLFRYASDNPVDHMINSILPDGRMLGQGVSWSSGAGLTTDSHPFIYEKGETRPIAFPEAFKNWARKEIVAVRSDGALLVQTQSTGSNPAINPEKSAERLFWIKDGKIVESFGAGCDPVIGPNGEFAYTQCMTPEGQIGPSNAHPTTPSPCSGRTAAASNWARASLSLASTLAVW